MDIRIKSILVPVDFSVAADFAFQYALAIADRHGAAVELLHVTEVSAYSNEEPLEGDEHYEAYEERLMGYLRKMIASAKTDIPIEANLITGVPYVEIVNRAKAWPANLIVIGTHGRTGMKHLLIGSVAERVIRTASCPVLTVRHPDHEL